VLRFLTECLARDGTIDLGMRDTECGKGQPDYDGKREAGFAELQRVEVPSLPLSDLFDGV